MAAIPSHRDIRWQIGRGRRRVCLNMGCFPGRRSRRRLPIAVPGLLEVVRRYHTASPLRRFVEPSWLSLRQRPWRSHPFHLPTISSGPTSFAREPFLLEGEDAATALAPGTPRRARARLPRWPSSTRAHKVPSTRWRRRWSLLLGLDRLLSQDEPALVDGTVLSAHQVDALSGTLTALLAEAQRNGNGRSPTAPSPTSRSSSPPPGLPGEEELPEELREDEDGDEDPVDWSRPRRGGRRGRRRPQRRQALLVRARHRRRQDRRRARLRRGVADRRHPDPHPPPQPRRPVPRRAARPRLRQADLAGAARRQGPGQRPGHRRDLPVVRPQRGQDLRRLHDRHLRRGAHRAGREDVGRDPRLDRPGVRRHDRDGRADRPPRHRPLPDADLALRPRPGRPPGGDRAAALREDPAGAGRAHDRQGAAAPR